MGGRPGRGRSARPANPCRIVAMNPVAQRLSVHPATLRRLRPAAPLQHERQRQHPVRRLGFSRARRLPPKLHRRKLAARDLHSHLGSPRPTGRVNQHRSVLKRPVESGLRAVGMIHIGARHGRHGEGVHERAVAGGAAAESLSGRRGRDDHRARRRRPGVASRSAGCPGALPRASRRPSPGRAGVPPPRPQTALPVRYRSIKLEIELYVRRADHAAACLSKRIASNSRRCSAIQARMS
jgi:hypothetical protein